jgi:hypothetical protein
VNFQLDNDILDASTNEFLIASRQNGDQAQPADPAQPYVSLAVSCITVVLIEADFRKDWQRRVRVHFDQVNNTGAMLGGMNLTISSPAES